jgi:rhodanese-related sulfurtransferase
MPRTIDREDVDRLLADGAALVDVLPVVEFSTGHLPRALNMPLATLPREALQRLDRGKPVVVYCYDFQ